MRALLTCLVIFSLPGCTALMVGGAAAGGYQVGKDERSAAQVSADGATTATIKTRLAADSLVNAFNVNVDTYAGQVTLRGTVGSAAARSRAQQIASGMDGVVSVRNELRVAASQ